MGLVITVASCLELVCGIGLHCYKCWIVGSGAIYSVFDSHVQCLIAFDCGITHQSYTCRLRIVCD